MGFSLGKILGGAAAVVNPVAALGTALGMGGDIYSAYQTSQNVESANVNNANMAREAMGFSGSQSAQQMAFQERMAGSAHQREVADLKAAGLNPLLSVNSGADSPGGASGSGVVSPAQSVPSWATGIGASARESIGLLSNLRESNSRVELNRDTGAAARARAGLDRRTTEAGGFDLDVNNALRGMFRRFSSGAKSLYNDSKRFMDDSNNAKPGWRTLDVPDSSLTDLYSSGGYR